MKMRCKKIDFEQLHRSWLKAWSAGVLLLLALLHTAPAQVGHAVQQPVTYSHEIARLLYKSCTACHHTGGSAPFSLMTYAEAKRWSSSIQAVTESRYMPPWLPAPGHGEFAGERRLSNAEIASVKGWVQQGVLEGDPASKPAAPIYAADWQLGKPDLILEVDTEMRVPPAGPDLFRNFILPFPLQQSRWVRAMEIKPGSPRLVHHANLILDRSGSLRRTHPDWRRGIPGMDVVVDAGSTFDPDGYFLDWKPDSTALAEPAGMAWRLDPGDDLVLNMHLKPTGKTEIVRARIGLYFTDQPPTKLPILVQLEHDAALKIPAGDASFVVEDHLVLPEAVDVLAIYPHAHYLGKRLEGWAELPNHSRQDLILIPDWDIDRQSIYRFANPVSLPAMSILHMRFTFDNSSANPRNPNSPPIAVSSGDRSVDEMGHLWVQLLPRPSAGATEDARSPILRSWMENDLQKNPDDPTALFNLASLDEAAGKNQEAIELYTRAVASRPNDARMLTALSSALNAAGEWQEAEGRMHAAIQSDPTYADAHFDLAMIDLQHEQYTEAETEFRALLSLRPRDVEAHLGLASALVADGRQQEGGPEFLRAVEFAGNDGNLLYRIAVGEAQAGLSADALSLLKRLSIQQPERIDVREGLTALYAKQGRLQEAIAEQRVATHLDPLHPSQWDNLGSLLARAGERQAATEAFEKALSLDPGDASASRGLELLRRLP